MGGKNALKLDPLHLSPAQAMKAATARLASASTDPVESEAGDKPVKEPSNKSSLAWMRWRMARECDFKKRNEHAAEVAVEQEPAVPVPSKIPLRS